MYGLKPAPFKLAHYQRWGNGGLAGRLPKEHQESELGGGWGAGKGKAVS